MIYDLRMQIFKTVSGTIPMKMLRIGCQDSQVNIGSGYGLVPSGNTP